MKGPTSATEVAYRESIARGLAAAWARAGASTPTPDRAARAAARELLRLPPAVRAERVKADARLQRYQGWKLLFERALALVPAYAHEAGEVARLALAVACRLDSVRAGEGIAADCRALSAVAIARARLAAGDPVAAQRAVRVAEVFFERASGDPCVLAEIERARAAVARAEGRPRAARSHLRRAAELYAKVGEAEREAAARAEAAAIPRKGAPGATP